MSLRQTLEATQALLTFEDTKTFPGLSEVTNDQGELVPDLPEQWIVFDLITDRPFFEWDCVKDADATIQVTVASQRRTKSLDLLELVQGALIPAYYRPEPVGPWRKLRGYVVLSQDFIRNH